MDRDTKWLNYLSKRTTPPPRLLFKYTSIETARVILQTEAVRFQSPLEYNDPFDTQWDIHWQTLTPQFADVLTDRFLSLLADGIDETCFHDEQYRAAFIQLRDEMSGMKELERREHIGNMVTQIGGSRFGPPEIWRAMLRRLRVLCLSEIPDSLLMWSHYADHHRGVVLVFDSSDLEYDWKMAVEPVLYSEMLPETFDSKGKLDELIFGTPVVIDHDLFAKIIPFTKAQAWSYEREWRFIFIEKGRVESTTSDTKFVPTALCGLIAGCRANPAEIKELGRLASRYPNVQLRRAKMHKCKFQLEIAAI